MPFSVPSFAIELRPGQPYNFHPCSLFDAFGAPDQTGMTGVTQGMKTTPLSSRWGVRPYMHTLGTNCLTQVASPFPSTLQAETSISLQALKSRTCKLLMKSTLVLARFLIMGVYAGIKYKVSAAHSFIFR